MPQSDCQAHSQCQKKIDKKKELTLVFIIKESRIGYLQFPKYTLIMFNVKAY